MRLSWRPAAMRRVAKAEQCFARSRLRSLIASRASGVRIASTWSSRLLDRRTRPSWWPHKLSSDSPQLWWSLGEKLGQHKGVAQCFARAGIVEDAPRWNAGLPIPTKSRPHRNERSLVVLREIGFRRAVPAIVAHLFPTAGLVSPGARSADRRRRAVCNAYGASPRSLA